MTEQAIRNLTNELIRIGKYYSIDLRDTDKIFDMWEWSHTVEANGNTFAHLLNQGKYEDIEGTVYE